MKTILATTATTIYRAHSYALDKLEELLEIGSITSLYVLAPLAKSRKARRAVLSSLDVRFRNYVLFPLEEEKPDAFTRRVIYTYDVTHVVDIDTGPEGILGTVVRTPSLREVFVNKWVSNNQKEWHKINKWLIKTTPQFTPTNEAAKYAFSIIETGYMSRRE